MRPLLLAPLLLAACLAPDEPPARVAQAATFAPPLETLADTLAFRAAAYAGHEAWQHVPYVAFRFGRAGEADTSAAGPAARRHLWNRTTGDYRIDVPRGDTLYTALFNVRTREGQVYRDGEPLSAERNAEWLESAHGMFINDTYWLLAPLKLFDDGVIRDRDASEDTDAEQALTLAFDGVGRTPGDRYWLYVDRTTGRVNAWRFHLQGQSEPGPRIERIGYQPFETPSGTVRLATRHDTGPADLFTDGLRLPTEVDERAFTDPSFDARSL
jgi:hypothetical protein